MAKAKKEGYLSSKESRRISRENRRITNEYEKQRKRMIYVPEEAHDYSAEQPELQEITPGHFVRCNGAELEEYRRRLGLA